MTQRGYRIGAALAAAVMGVLVAVAGCATPPSSGADRIAPRASRSAAAPPTDPPPGDGPSTHAAPPTDPPPGDGPPNHADNRGHLQPRELDPRVERQLESEAQRIEAALDELRRDGAVGPDAVEQAIASLGYPKQDIQVVSRQGVGNSTPYIVFGVRSHGGCVKGSVWPSEVRAGVEGPIAEWGCLPPDTH